MEIQPNNIYLGDSYDLIKNIANKSIDCIYTDIPYLYIKGGGTKGSEMVERSATQRESLKEFKDGIDYSIFNDFIRVSKKLNLFIWCSRLQIPDILNFFCDKSYLFNILVWTKNNPIPTCNQRWLEDVEYCLYFRESGISLNDGYEHKSKWYNSSINKADKILFEHPTIKPLEFVKKHLQHTTKENDVVLDCFMGSGTTCIACKELNRQYIGIEKNEKWFNVAKNRLDGINASGQTSFILR